MALTIKPAKDPGSGNEVEASERLCITDDDRLVPEDHPDARRLWCTPGDMIPRDVAEKYGLLKKRRARSEGA
jgi:hypothetical protein